MKDQQSSYRQIMKATSLFGGVQVFNIIISIIRSKFVAVLLGPAGLGLIGLLTSTTGLIGSITNFGLGVSAVKDIVEANNTGDKQRIAIVVTVFRRLVWITGLLGTLSIIILSPWLSQLTFGNKDYTITFILISITLLFAQLSNGQLVILQGLRQLNQLAKANILGSALGLIVAIPLYYSYGIEGIVPGIIGTALISLFLSWYYSKKNKINTSSLSVSQIFSEGKNMLRMGLMISLSSLFSIIAAYLIRIYISRSGGLEQVGLYSAGFAIINSYVGLIFNAMGTDYYPRLSTVSHDKELYNQTINQQAEIAMLILAPILIIFLFGINWVIVLIYSKQFIAINSMMHWAALGMFFKATSWAIAFIFLAKGSGKLFLWNELTSNLYVLFLNIIGYHNWGLTGLGISFLLAYLLYLLHVYLLSKIVFNFSFNSAFVKIFILQFSLAVISFVTVKYLPQSYAYLIGSLLIVFSSWHSIKELDKRLGIFEIIRNFKKNHNS